MKIKSFFISLIVLVFLEIFIAFTFWGRSFWISFGASLVVLIFFILWAVGLPFKKWFSKEVFTHAAYLVLPVVFYASSLFFLLLIQSNTFKHLFIVGVAILFLIILLGVRGVILNLEHKIKPRLTYNFLVISTILTSFLAYVVIWAFFRDLNLSIWIVLITVFLITFLLFYQILHLFGILRKRSIIYAIFVALVVIEIAWILCFWPLEYFFSGILLTIVFYTLWGLIHHELEDSLSRKIVLEYLAIAVIIFFIIFSRGLMSLGLSR